MTIVIATAKADRGYLTSDSLLETVGNNGPNERAAIIRLLAMTTGRQIEDRGGHLYSPKVFANNAAKLAGVVIGSVARYVSVHDSLKHVAGYCIVNDVSEREFQIERGGQWTKGKSADTFCPIGPWLVTADEVPDPGNLDLFCEVNGKRMQNGTTANLIFSVAHIVSYISHFMTLMPGDVIPTGTPAGVGLGMKPQLFLKPGDAMRLGISGLGEQHQKVVGFRE